MKKKVAVFTNGWNDDYLDFALEGIRKRAAEDNIDIFIFLDYTSYDITEDNTKGELNILNLPDLNDFEGVLLLGNTLNNAGENAILREKVLDAGVPSICLEAELEGINCIRTENINGMRELMEHMVVVHDVKDVFWISGPFDNEESQARYKAVVEIMEKYGLTFDQSKIFEGCWSYKIVEEQLPDVVSKLDKLPDAFICANDSMALATCVVLDKLGIKVPQDVKVTGYDNLRSGNNFSPILASVDRGWEERCYQAMDSLVGLMNGEPDFGDKVFDSKFDLGESCGCSMGNEGIRIQQEARRRSFIMPVERTLFDWHLIEMDNCVAHVKDPDDVHTALTEMWEKSHSYEGDDFFVCLDQSFVDSMGNDENSRSEGYSDTIDIICGMKDGVSVKRHTISRSDMVPYYDNDSKETVIYVFVPLHAGAECIGYFLGKNNHKLITDFYMNSLVRHTASAIERARQNIRLENLNKILAEISVRDELTSLYNRMGYEKIVIPYLDELRHAKSRAIIVVADINRMKVINDHYGHLQGDLAIKIVAEVIKNSVPKSWKAVRYGGDEFVIIGEYDDTEKMLAIKSLMEEKSKHISDDYSLPFKLSVSFGYVVVEPDTTLEYDEYFRMADEAMYEMKQEAHKKDDR